MTVKIGTIGLTNGKKDSEVRKLFDAILDELLAENLKDTMSTASHTPADNKYKAECSSCPHKEKCPKSKEDSEKVSDSLGSSNKDTEFTKVKEFMGKGKKDKLALAIEGNIYALAALTDSEAIHVFAMITYNSKILEKYNKMTTLDVIHAYSVMLNDVNDIVDTLGITIDRMYLSAARATAYYKLLAGYENVPEDRGADTYLTIYILNLMLKVGLTVTSALGEQGMKDAVMEHEMK